MSPPEEADADADAGSAKRVLRRRLLAARALRPAAERVRVARALADRVERLAEVRTLFDQPAARVAAYVSLGSEPGTGPLLERLRMRGLELIVPVLCDDDDLDWALFSGPDNLVPGRYGLRQPTGSRLGRDAVAYARLALVPALAVDPTGRRLGRGGGSYDRALARVSPGAPVLALLHDDELLARVPVEPHDRLVDGAVTSTRVLRAAPTGHRAPDLRGHPPDGGAPRH